MTKYFTMICFKGTLCTSHFRLIYQLCGHFKLAHYGLNDCSLSATCSVDSAVTTLASHGLMRMYNDVAIFFFFFCQYQRALEIKKCLVLHGMPLILMK